MAMGRPGVIAFPVLLVLGAITGYLTYDMLVIQSTPVEGVYDGSPYRKDLPSAQTPSAPQTENAAAEEQPAERTPAMEIPTEEPASVVTITILKGSSASGAPDYDPDHATVPLSATIRWVNEDTVLHTATSGAGFEEDGFGSKFDTQFLFTGKEYNIAASDIGPGEYTYFCQAHPFMVGTLAIQ
jgi:plastocyanin